MLGLGSNGGFCYRGPMASEVLVIGAGLSGLRAAEYLTNAGVDALVLEARDRVGGRLWSRTLANGVFDIGGQWIGPGQHRMYALAKRLGLETFPTYGDGKKILGVGEKISYYRTAIPRVGPLDMAQLGLALAYLEFVRRGVDPAKPWAARGARRFDAVSVEALKRKLWLSKSIDASFDAALRVIFGVENSELSVLHFLAYQNAGGGLLKLAEIRGGAQQDRIAGGAQGLAKGLAASLGDKLMLSTPVHAVERQAGGVVVYSGTQRFEAKRAILALPPLLAGRLRHLPELPQPTQQLLQRFPMGMTIKVLATYERPFWRAKGFSGEAVLDSGPFSVVFDNCDVNGRQAALVGFSVAQPGRDFARLPETERKRRALAEFARLFGPEARDATAYVEQNWAAEEYSQGCPVGVLGTGVWTTSGHALREPVGPIHFAGTETATQWMGYMEGAVQAGERAAEEVLAAL